MSQTKPGVQPSHLATVPTGGGSKTEQYAVRVILPATIPTMWPTIAPMIERAIRHGQGDSVTMEHIYSQLVAGEWGLWGAINQNNEIKAVMAFEVSDNVANRVMYGLFLAGEDLPGWVDKMEKYMQRYRDEVRADCIEISTRPGLAHKLKKRGWKQKAIIMEAP